MTRRPSPWVALAGLALVLAGCATKPSYTEPAYTLAPAPRVVLDRVSVDRDVQDRILALNPERITDDDVRMTLAKGPTPRIVNIHGGIYPVHLVMESFSRFLMRMGYPETKIRDPRTGELSQSPYLSSQATAGEVAWFYEREGVRPMLVGHSQGGMQAVKILFELAGKFDESVPVTNPLTGEKEARAARGRPRAAVYIGGGCRRGRDAASEPVEHGDPAALDSGLGRGFHGLHHRVRPDRLGFWLDQPL
jgi:hypothetical protein